MSGSKPEALTAQLGNTDAPSPEQQHHARLVVAANAHDVDDCRDLLQALGLINPGFHWIRSTSGHGTHKRRKVEHPRPEPESEQPQPEPEQPQPRTRILDNVDASIAYHEKTLHMLENSQAATETQRESVRRTITNRRQLKNTLQERT